MGPAPSAAKETGSNHVVFQKGISMNRSIARILALTAGLAIASSANAQSIAATAPVIDGPAGGATNIEFIGFAEDTDQRIVLTFTATTSIADNNANAILRLQFQMGTGANTGGPINIGPDDGSAGTGLFRQVTGDGDANIEAGEVWSFDVSSAFGSLPSDASLMAVTWAPAGDNISLPSNADGQLDGAGTDAIDQRFEIVRTRTTLANAFINGSGVATECNLTFAFPTVGRSTNATAIAISGLPASNPNGSVAGGGAATDFTFVDASNIATQQFNSNVAPAGTADINAASFAIIGNGQSLRFTFDSANSTLDTAGARFSTTAASNVRDAAGNRVVGASFNSAVANNRGFVLTSALPSPTFTAARFLTATQIQATFSTPVDKTALPSANFFDLNLTGGTVTNLTNVGVVINAGATNAAANNVVIFDVNANLSPGAGDNIGVAANGIATDANGAIGTYTDSAGQTFTLVADENTGTTDLTDIFGATLGGATTAMESQVVTDGIVPVLQAVGFLDRDRDGDQDAAYFRYNEPMSSTTAATGIMLKALNGVAVNPFRQLNMTTGVLGMDTTNVTAPMDVITITTVETASVDPDPNNVPATPNLEGNNSIIVNFNPDTFDWDTGGTATLATEAIPGTGNASALSLEYDMTVPVAGSRIRDLAGNEAATVGVSPTAEDRAGVVIGFTRFSTGDNGNNLFSEQDGVPGDGVNNNTVTFFGGENFNGGMNAGNVTESQVRFGVGGTSGFSDAPGSFGAVAANSVSFTNAGNSPNIIAGVVVSILPNSRVRDAAGNESVSGDMTTANFVGPYCPLAVGVDGGANIDAAFLFDANASGFADSIRITMTQPIDTATVQLENFRLDLGTITAVEVQGVDIVLTVTDGIIPMTSVVNVTYLGSTDTTPIRSLTTGGGTGIAVSAVDDTVQARRIPTPDRATQELAFMDFVGTITMDGTTPAPAGTKVYAMTAAPAIYSVTATHNNVAFTVDVLHDSSDSIYAWNAWLYGVQEFIYLGRNSTNFQEYRNKKYDFSTSNDDLRLVEDIISLNVNATNLTSITFTGIGENTNDKVTNGRARLCWDVLRSNLGTPEDFFVNYTSTNVRNFANNGVPLRSSAVVLGTDGRYELHHSAPASVFNGINRLNSVGRPVILIVELPDGKRFAVSGINASINGAPVLFAIQNRAQTTGQANNATTFNINLANVGMVPVYAGWNIVPFARNSGWAATTGARPVRVNGVSESAIVVPGTGNPVQPFAGPLDQFVWWGESTVDGMWTRGEDTNLTNIIVDPDYFPYFAFTMTSFGVQAGSLMNNLVGGYALAFFHNADWFTNYGIFQFGAPLTGNTLFDGLTPATSFPNNATTQGWGLFTAKAAYNPATGARGTNNPDLDFIFVFRNNGPNAASLGRPRIEVSSLDLIAPTGTDNPNDTTRIDAAQGFFGHFQP